MTTVTRIKLVILAAAVGLGMMLMIGFGLVVLFAGGGSRNRSDVRGQAQPGKVAFDAASNRIVLIDLNTNKVAYGNTPEAEKAAAEFAGTMEVMQKLAFTGGKKGGASLSGGRFLVHCQLQDGRAGFLVHVPQLRNYKDKEVRLALAKLAWSTAKAVTKDLRKDQCWELGLGLRGALAYGVVAAGSSEGEPAIEQGSIVQPDRLYPFFAPAALPKSKIPGEAGSTRTSAADVKSDLVKDAPPRPCPTGAGGDLPAKAEPPPPGSGTVAPQQP